MSGGKNYKPVGGVAAAELFAVRGLVSPRQMAAGGGTAVEIADTGSSYTETFSVDEGRVSVEHVLVLRADLGRAEAWFDGDFLARCGAEGVAARIVLASGETIVAGWSQRFGFEQALRLRSLALRSGDKAVDEPHAELTLACRDTSRALGEDELPEEDSL